LRSARLPHLWRGPCVHCRLHCTPANISILHGRAVKRLQKLAAEEGRRGMAAGLAWFRPTL
jgi:hypothetical protein